MRLNCRQPTKDDYANFVLYQVNQKAYEAVLLKNFIAHALHPNQVDDCFPDSPDGCAAIEPYLQAVVYNVNAIAEKMIWNAHCRAVNMLPNDGKDGAPFIDVHQFKKTMFSDFCPDNPITVAFRVNESWHRGISDPDMVRMSTKQYPIGVNVSPMEEIDEISKRMFNDIALTEALPICGATKPATKRKGKGQGAPGAAVREAPQIGSRGNWLAFPVPEAPQHSPTPPPPQALTNHEEIIPDVDMLADEEARLLQSLRNVSYGGATLSDQAQDSTSDSKDAEANSTRLVDLVSRYRANALDSDRIDTPASREDEAMITKVPSWHTWLIDDHRRRLTERWGHPPQILRRVLPGIKQIIAEALVRGIRPTNDDYHNKIKIIEARARQHLHVAPLLSSVSSLQHVADRTIVKKKEHVDVPRKRRKMYLSTSSVTKMKCSKKHLTKIDAIEGMVGISPPEESDIYEPPLPHPSGSVMLDLYQELPPNAYFEQQHPDEKPAWRCGIKHAMGYYYNAGNCSGCPGCSTNVNDCTKTKHMDFYLPPSACSFQPAHGVTWTPSKALAKSRRSKHLSHNSIAKMAY
jgi:hypothetical protein